MSESALTLCQHDFPDTLCPYCWRERAEKAEAEVARLRAGRFTPDELQTLCHGLTAGDACAFVRGCRDYQLALFGRAKVEAALDQLWQEYSERHRCKECGDTPDLRGLVEHRRGCSKADTIVEELAP